MVNRPTKLFLTLALLLAGIACLAQEGLEGVCKSVPGGVNNVQYLYVFGPQAHKGEGRDDTVQVNFYRVRADANEHVTIYVFDPASGNNVDPKRWPLRAGLPTMTTLSVYGGIGAHSDPQSRNPRPSAQQAGKLLDSQSFSAYSEQTWAQFGPYSPAQGERIGDWIYFKLVVHAPEGSERNFFKTAVCPYEAVAFTYNVSAHLARDMGDHMNFEFEVPPYTKRVIEYNYDFDRGGRASIYRNNERLMDVVTSGTGKWASNELPVRVQDQSERMLYTITKGTQAYANASFYFTDGEGNPLKIFYHSTAVPRPTVPGFTSDCHVQTELIDMRKMLPTDVAVDEDFEAVIEVMALQDTQSIVVQDVIPDPVGYLRSTPPADVFHHRLTWRFDDVRAGEKKTIKIHLRALREGDITGCAVVNVTPRGRLITEVGEAVLNITKNAPVRARKGEEVLIKTVVENTGSVAARNTVVTDVVPRGLDHHTGQRTFTYNVGDLLPGESRAIEATFRAIDTGQLCSRAVATADFTPQVMAEACTLVEAESVSLTITGPETRVVGKHANYVAKLTNSGETTLTNVALALAAPAAIRLVEAPDATLSGNRATWLARRLEAGETRTYNYRVVSAIVGTHCTALTSACAEGLEASGEGCTEWTGKSAILLEVIDTADPVVIGAETSFVIKVRNQGSAPEESIVVIAEFPPEFEPMKTQGPTVADMLGQVVTFRPYARLAGHETIEYSIRARAKVAGDARLSVKLSSRLLDPPLVEEESTQVY